MFIYGLFCTKDNVIRYVGKTKNTLKERLNQHLNGALKKQISTYKDRWIRKCYSEGFEIKIVVIETVNADNVNEREIFWINQFPNLTNTAPGGEGGGLLIYDKLYVYCKNWLKENAPDVKSNSQYQQFSRASNFPSFLPKYPCKHFKSTDEWVSWGDFLSTGRIQDNKKAIKYLSYTEAKQYLKPIKILTKKEYIKYLSDKSIDFLPKKPERFYGKRGWEGYGLFLGIKKSYQITEPLLVRYLNTFFKEINTEYKYKKYSKKLNNALPKNILTLKKRFPNFKWHLVNRHMITDYKSAEKLVRELNITNYNEYIEVVENRYKGILPLQPNLKYKEKGWRNFMTFFGNSKIKHKCDITIETFRRYMKFFFPSIDSATKFLNFYRSNKERVSKRLPSRPDIVFNMPFSKIFLTKHRREVPICNYEHFVKTMSANHSDVIHMWQYKGLCKNGILEKEFPQRPTQKYKKKWTEMLNDIKANKN